MKIIKEKIKEIKWDSSNFYILCNKIKLKIDIIDGSVNIIIKNTNNEIVGISYLEKDDIIKILYVSERYVELVEYFHNIYGEEKSFTDIDRMIYSDVLYRLGKYKEAINSLEFISEDYPIDEKYFLLALYNKKTGNIHAANVYLDNLISDYPGSEYYKLAKLQYKSFK